MIKDKLPCPAGAAGKVAQATREAFEKRPGARLNTADGLRVDLPEGWLSIRASNTEPILRLTIEAPDKPVAEFLAAELRAITAGVLSAPGE